MTTDDMGFAVSKRKFPIAPRSTRKLEVGDLIAVPCDPSGWACLQIVDLKKSGPGWTTSLIVGALPWHGDSPPTADGVSGIAATRIGITNVQIFTEGGLKIVGATDVVPHGFASNYRDFAIGTVHYSWGWKAAIAQAQAVSESS